MASKADEIREYALAHHVQPWRRSGAKRLSIRAGDIVRGMRLSNATPNVCSALRTQEFRRQAGLVLVHQEGPQASTTTTFHYESDRSSPNRSVRTDAETMARTSSPEPRFTRPRHDPDGGLQDVDLCLVSCVRLKRDVPAMARDLYISPWFCKARALVEAIGCRWYILSAKYGLVDPNAMIKPYDKTLNNMRVGERREWARGVLRDLDPHLAHARSIAFLAGAKYREFLERELRGRGIAVSVPMEGMRIGEQRSWLNQQVTSVKTAHPPPDRFADTIRFYELLARLEERAGGHRTLATCDGRLAWPRRGVYFFFEGGEERNGSGRGSRVVRIGTHAIEAKSHRSLWNRLYQHRGAARSGGGNHRGSIFRLMVGVALSRRGDSPLPASWGIGSDAGAAARKLVMNPDTVRSGELALEQRVSEFVGHMPFLWLDVDDPPGPSSQRAFIERNAIALLSRCAPGPVVDEPSSGWLGAFSDRARVRGSGLWNNHHVEERHDPLFLDAMEALVDRWRG